MIAALSIGFVGAAVAVLLFVLVSDAAHRRTARGVATSTVGQSRWARFWRYRDAASERRAAAGPPTVAKEVIRAMAHRAVYRLEEPRAEDESDTGRWARRLLAGTCDKLDGYMPEALKLERIADAFCDRANATCDTFEARLLQTFGTRWGGGGGVIRYLKTSRHEAKLKRRASRIHVSWDSGSRVENYPTYANTHDDFQIAVRENFRNLYWAIKKRSRTAARGASDRCEG